MCFVNTRWTIKGFSTKTEPGWDLSSLSFAWLSCEVISSSPDWHSFIVLIVGSPHLGDPAWIMTSASNISLLMILAIIVSHCYFLHCSSGYLNVLVLFLLSLHIFIGLLMLPLSFTRKERKEMKRWNIRIKDSEKSLSVLQQQMWVQKKYLQNMSSGCLLQSF